MSPLETETEALRIEAILIQQTPDLTNEQAGHNIDDLVQQSLGTSVEVRCETYESDQHDAILLNIKNTYKPELDEYDVEKKSTKVAK